MEKRRLHTRFVVLLLAVGLLAPATSGQKAPPPPAKSAATPAEKIKRAGLPNLGRVSDTLYRGAQPKKEGYAQLKDMGIAIVVNLRAAGEDVEKERGAVENQGMRFVSLPWSATSQPHPADVAAFLTLLRDNPGKKVFVHCQRGAERTGVMVAAYRIARENWTPPQALEEMEAFGFRGLLYRSYKKFVRGLPELLQTHPALAPLRKSAAAPN